MMQSVLNSIIIPIIIIISSIIIISDNVILRYTQN